MPNRLAAEASPYLRQHADNPVDWWPWSDEAFAHAAATDRPVFLSIGYATCHWCHVMAHESFEDADVAAALNDAFVCVKVDREERPDVDALYMAVCQEATGRGGWPLTVLLTPDRRPFFVGTYFPPRSRHGRSGVVELCAAISAAWTNRRAEVEASAGHLTAQVQRRFAPAPAREAAALGAHTFEAADEALRAAFDPIHGGFGRAPKFPRPHVLAYLMRRYRRTGAPDLLAMVVTTLKKMQQGGLHDHVGGGFHRYSTDAEWRLPHFEKMLYDQAGLLAAYAEAAGLTGRGDFRETAEGIARYVERDLTGPGGAFFCAEDADSARADGTMHEGAFYVWTEAELTDALGEADAALFARVYGFEPGGNFLDEATRERTGENVLHLSAPVRDLAPSGTDPDAFAERIAAMRERLFEARTRRPRPLLDDKVLADWNGWMAHALLVADRHLVFAQGNGQEGADDVPALAARARRGLSWMRETFVADGRLLHRYHGGAVGIDGVADDYAFFVHALLEASRRAPAAWLPLAVALTDRLVEDHWDEARGLFTTARRDAEGLIAAPADRYDGAMPSANGVALANLVTLARLTGRSDYQRLADRMLDAAAPEIASHPTGFAAWLLTLDTLVSGSREVVVTHAAGDEARAARMAADAERLAPDAAVYVVSADAAEALRTVAPALSAYPCYPDGPLAYVCRDFACEAPVSTPEALRAALGA